MKKRYTFAYTKTVHGTVTVTESDDREAEILAREAAETLNEDETGAEVTFLDLRDAEPDGPDRDEE